MENKFQLFEDLLAILKHEREIKNTEQAVEIISLMLFLHYLYLFFGEKNDPYIKLGDIFLDNEENDDVKRKFKNLISRFFNYEPNEELALLEKTLLNSLTSLFTKVDFKTIKTLNDRILTIDYLDEFYTYAETYHSLIERMIREMGSTGEFYTPKVLADVIVNILDPDNSNSIYDPACGTAGFLIESANYIKRNDKKAAYRLAGQDNSSFACIISLVNLLINKERNFAIYNQDSLTLSDDIQAKYDIIISNPPFGKINSSFNDNRYKDYGQFIDYHFLKHIMDSLAIGGKAAVILPDRFFNDGNAECLKLKEELFNNFNVDCVLSIPSGAMLPYTAVKISVLFFSNTGPTEMVWVYKLDEIEKYTKNNSVKLKHFKDFLHSFKLKQTSKNAWIVNISEINSPYNLLERNTQTPQYGVLDEPKINIDRLITNNQKIIDKFIKIKERIIKLENIINTNHSKYDFKKFKLGDITSLKTGSLLPKQKLLEHGDYPVFGGNGKIGYYNQFTISDEIIIIGKIGELCGNVRYFKGEAWITNNAVTMKNISPNNVHTPYLAKVLSMTDLRSLAVGTAQQYITLEKINNVEISIPPIEAQIELNNWLNDLEVLLKEYDSSLKEIIDDKEKIKADLFNLLLKI